MNIFKKCKNKRCQGDVGVGEAISYFLKHGYMVLLPIGEASNYDLCIEKNGKIQSVQVKTCSYVRKTLYDKVYEVTLFTDLSGERRPIGKKKVDMLFIVTGNGKKYLIPFDVIRDIKTNIKIGGEKYKRFEV